MHGKSSGESVEKRKGKGKKEKKKEFSSSIESQRYKSHATETSRKVSKSRNKNDFQSLSHWLIASPARAARSAVTHMYLPMPRPERYQYGMPLKTFSSCAAFTVPDNQPKLPFDAIPQSARARFKPHLRNENHPRDFPFLVSSPAPPAFASGYFSARSGWALRAECVASEASMKS